MKQDGLSGGVVVLVVLVGPDGINPKFKTPDRGAITPAARLEEKMNKHQSPQSSVSKSFGNDVSGDLLKSHECTPSVEFLPDIDASYDTYLPDILTRTAVFEVLRALHGFTYRLSEQIFEICDKNLPTEARAEFQKLWGPFDDWVGAELRLTEKVSAMVNRPPPPTLTTMEDMVHQALKNAGFCCAGAVDAYVAEECGQEIGLAERQLPDFDSAWLTLAGRLLFGSMGRPGSD